MKTLQQRVERKVRAYNLKETYGATKAAEMLHVNVQRLECLVESVTKYRDFCRCPCGAFRC
jgi:hypothetical protein